MSVAFSWDPNFFYPNVSRKRDRDATDDGEDENGTGLNPGDRYNPNDFLGNFLNVRPPTGDPRDSFEGDAFRLDGLTLYGKGMD